MGYDYDELGISSGFGVTAFILILSSCISIYNCSYHMKHIVYQEAQIRLVPYLFSPVVIGWLGWSELMIAQAPPYLSTISDWYTALTVICFVGYAFKIIGAEQVGESIEFSQDRLEMNLTCNTTVRNPFRKIELNSKENAQKFMSNIWIFVYQFAAVITITSLIGLIIRLAKGQNLYEPGDASMGKAYLYLNIIKVISTFLAISRLSVLSSVFNHVSAVTNIRLATKIKTVQLSIMLRQVQGLIISVCVQLGVPRGDGYDKDEKVIWTENTLVASEMLVLAFVIILMFPMVDYERLKNIGSPINQTYNNRSV